MKVFRDRNRRDWSIEASGGALLRVFELTGIDLVEIIDPDSNLLPRLCLQPWLLAKVLAALCQPEIAARDMTPDQFKALLVPGVQDDAREALLEELPDFFFRPHQPLIAKLIKRLRAKIQTTAVQTMAAVEHSPDDPADDPPTSGTSSGPSGVASTSTHDPSS